MCKAHLRPLGLLILVGCGPTVGVPGEAEEETSAVGSSSAGGTTHSDGAWETGVGTSGGSVATFGGESDSDGDDGAGFIVGWDGGWSCAPAAGGTLPLSCCDVWSQDCPDGQKCLPWSNDGSGVWNSTYCGWLDPEPDPIGAPCTVENGPASGVDSCVLGAMCWNVDPETLEGHCVGFCQGTEANSWCEVQGHACMISNSGVLIVCLPTCDPLGEDCGDGVACHPNGSNFVCVPTEDRGKITTGCEAYAGCPAGEACVGPPEFDACIGGCCRPYCDLDDPLADTGCSALEEAWTCVPWFEEQTAPPEYAHVGVCGPARGAE